jgi:hypothetical protein
LFSSDEVVAAKRLTLTYPTPSRIIRATSMLVIEMLSRMMS